ncbi:hypothetical protein WDW89_23610 [Deltaproteobacteria bacterium TL4]
MHVQERILETIGHLNEEKALKLYDFALMLMKLEREVPNYL